MIHEVVEKVSTWRQYYTGMMVPKESNPNEMVFKKWSLQQAADKVGITKKSLDDYLLQLRFGKKFGFDFEKNRNEKVGALRLFVKQEKNKVRQLTGESKISSKMTPNEYS